MSLLRMTLAVALGVFLGQIVAPSGRRLLRAYRRRWRARHRPEADLGGPQAAAPVRGTPRWRARALRLSLGLAGVIVATMTGLALLNIRDAQRRALAESTAARATAQADQRATVARLANGVPLWQDVEQTREAVSALRYAKAPVSAIATVLQRELGGRAVDTTELTMTPLVLWRRVRARGLDEGEATEYVVTRFGRCGSALDSAIDVAFLAARAKVPESVAAADRANLDHEFGRAAELTRERGTVADWVISDSTGAIGQARLECSAAEDSAAAEGLRRRLALPLPTRR